MSETNNGLFRIPVHEPDQGKAKTTSQFWYSGNHPSVEFGANGWGSSIEKHVSMMLKHAEALISTLKKINHANVVSKVGFSGTEARPTFLTIYSQH